MRLLHTSDWHLGATFEGISRDADHGFFLDWLLGQLQDRAIDVLVVAGDVFDQANPSPQAQSLYYRFLERARETTVAAIAVIGGNHDSPGRLDAPQGLLGALDIHVTGAMPVDRGRTVRVLADRQGRPGMVLALVPYVSEARLGVRSALASDEEVLGAYVREFTALYAEVADRAEQAGRLAGGPLPMVATGHLACTGAMLVDAPVEIHRVGMLGGLPSSIFDRRFDYVALGHIHRSYPVEKSRAWYSGSPLALARAEAKLPRRVLVVDLEAGKRAVVTPIDVPQRRGLVELTGDIPTIERALAGLTWNTPAPPLVAVDVEASHVPPGFAYELVRMTEARHADPPQIASVTAIRPTVPTVGAGATDAPPSLSHLTPRQVFARLCEREGVAGDAELLRVFETVVAERADEDPCAS
jgi:exonuclease SbcD